MRSSLLLVALLAACVHESPAAPEVEGVRAVLPPHTLYVGDGADSLRLFNDGTYEARTGDGLVVKLPGYGTAVMWTVGSYTADAGFYCARPNSRANAAPRCGGSVRGDVLADYLSVFLWDAVPREWRRR